jgi:hypothetical protein
MLKLSGSRPANPCSLTEVWCSLPYPMDVYDVLDGVMISSYVLLHVCKDLPDCVAGFTEGWGGKILCCVCIVLVAYRMKAGSLSESWWYTLGSLFLFLAAGTTMIGCPCLRLFIGALAASLSVSVWEYFWPVLWCRVLFCFVDFLVSSVFSVIPLLLFCLVALVLLPAFVRPCLAPWCGTSPPAWAVPSLGFLPCLVQVVYLSLWIVAKTER